MKTIPFTAAHTYIAHIFHLTLFPLLLFQGHVELVVGNYFTLTPAGAPEEKACMAERLAPQTPHLFFTLIVAQREVNGYLLYKEGS